MAYNWLAALGMVRRLLREALWAPALIVLAALAYCYLRAIAIAGPRLGALRPAAAYLLAFALSCSTALGWEIGEFIIDQFAGTTLQQGNYDTMSDLILGIAGAAAYLAAQAIRGSRGAS